MPTLAGHERKRFQYIKLPAEGDQNPRKWAVYEPAPWGWNIWRGHPYRRTSKVIGFIGCERVARGEERYAELQAQRDDHRNSPAR